MQSSRKLAVLSLLLLVPVPSLAVIVGLWLYPNTPFGQAFFSLGKLWVMLLPLGWFIFIERGRPSWVWPTRRGLAAGIITGFGIASIIALTYWLVARTAIDPAALTTTAATIGMDRPVNYLLLAAYWCLVNSLIEEYVWRWFVTRQFHRLMPALLAVLASAAGFTLHHIFAMWLYFPPWLVPLAALGVFIGGAIWSALYLCYRSIWPGYISHVLADLAIFAIGYRILFI